MGRDIPLGRFAGIRISMSWMVPAIAFVFALSLSSNLFPAQVPYQSKLSYWVAGLLAAILFFVSLLAHEIGHALVARNEGIGVEGISLWLLGGLAKLEHEAESPGAELRIAGAGPLTSAAVGVVFLLLGHALAGDPGMLAVFSHMFVWLGLINLVLAAFNLLPGVPLDGGRVLGALLWMRTNNRSAAQAATDRIGQGLGAAIIVLGAFLAANANVLTGVEVIVVGGYVLMSATAELKASGGLAILRDIRLGEVMDADPPSLPEWMTVYDLVANAHAYLPHTAFVTKGIDGRAKGLVTAEAVQATDPRSWPQLHLKDLAFPPERLQTAQVSDSVLITLQRSRLGATGRVLVLWPDGRVAGVTGSDLSSRAAALHRARTEPMPAPPANSWPGGYPPAPPGPPATVGPPQSWQG